MIYDVTGCRAVIFRPGMPLKDWLAKQKDKPFALINASLYESATVPVGTIIENGKVAHNAGSGFGFGVMPDGTAGFGSPWLGWRDYITGYTGLRQNGVYVAPAFQDAYVFASKLQRIGIGEKGGKLLIVTGDNMTIAQFGQSEPLDSLVNLDGGGSRYLYYNGKTIYSSSRTPYNAIAFYKNDTKDKEDGKTKIYISPSSQPANLYAAGNTNEQVQCRRIAECCAAALTRSGFDVKVGAAEIDYTGRVRESNAWGADIHIPIHTNAGGGRGPIVFVYSLSEARVALAQPVFDALNAIVPVKSKYGVQASKYTECTTTNAKCVYVEAAFHDNASEAAWIISHVQEIGEAIAKGICKGTGTDYKAPESKKPESLSWAIRNGIVKDGDDGTFMTRAELAEAIYAYNASFGAEDGKTVSGLIADD